MRPSGSDAGSGTVWVIVAVVVVAAVTTGVLTARAAAATRSRATAAADLAALAGAERISLGHDAACAAVTAVASANDAAVHRCEVGADHVEVWVVATGGGWTARIVRAVGRARAGPVEPWAEAEPSVSPPI